MRRRPRRLAPSALFRDRSGASAVEFAILALPFFLLLFGIIQVGIIFFTNFALDTATSQAARMIRTGQAQAQGFDAGQFKQEICDRSGLLIDCGKLLVDVRRYQSFTGMDLTEPVDANGNLNQNVSYDPGARNDIVVVRAFYPLSFVADLPSAVRLSNMSDGSRVAVSTAVFRNEPF